MKGFMPRMTEEEIFGEQEGSPRLNLPTHDCWREISMIDCLVKEIVSQPYRRLGIATFIQRVEKQ